MKTITFRVSDDEWTQFVANIASVNAGRIRTERIKPSEAVRNLVKNFNERYKEEKFDKKP